MKLLTGAVLSAVLLAASPAFADRGGDGYGHDRHHWKQSHHSHKHHRGPRHVVREEVHHYYAYAPAPAPAYSSPPSAGIHVVIPDVFIPWPN